MHPRPAPDGVLLREVTLAELLPARALFSYGGTRPPQQAVLPGDTDPRAVHLLATAGPRVVGAATLVWDPCELPTGELVVWRLRGLGVAAAVQGNGIGRELVSYRLGLVADRGGASAWCSARDGNVERFVRWGATPLGPMPEVVDNAPAGTTHTLLRWAAPS
jgi:GNAT superfamily N-acetyltransferase